MTTVDAVAAQRRAPVVTPLGVGVLLYVTTGDNGPVKAKVRINHRHYFISIDSVSLLDPGFAATKEPS